MHSCLCTRCKWAVDKKIMDLVEVIPRCKELYLLVGKCCFEPADLIWPDINYYHWQDTWLLGQGNWPMRGKSRHYLTNEHSTDRPPHSNEHQVKDLS